MASEMAVDPCPAPLLPSGRETTAPAARQNRSSKIGAKRSFAKREGQRPRPFPAGFLALIFVALSLLALPAAATEVITSFASAVTLRTDGSVEVTETIDIHAEGYEIRRGIYRDIPLVQVNRDRSRLRSSLDVVQVLRDGRPERYAIENLGAGFKRIRIGDPDVFLSYGAHRYTIRYTMTRMARNFPEHDELFWNATGNYWNFPILEAVVSMTLPEGAVIDRLVGYTGGSGSTEQAVQITRTSDNTAIFRVTRALASGEGVSVAASFQKGILAEPEALDRLAWWLSDHRELVLPGIAVTLVLLYYIVAWSSAGRDPRKGTIIPLFHAPKGFSPALTHYVHRMGWQKNGWTAFTAAIFDLGVKGLVKIANPGKTLTVTATGNAVPADLPAGEKLVQRYFSSRGSVTVDTTSGPKLNETRAAFLKMLESENRQVYFNNNVGYVVVGVVFSGLLLLGLVLFDMIDPLTLAFVAMGSVFLGVLAGILQGFWSSPGFVKVVLVIWVVIFSSNFAGAAVSLLGNFVLDLPLIGAASIILVNVIFAVLMRAPTVQGRKVMDQIDGFKMYLETAEKNRLNMTDEPPMTVERFERILPYAIVLGVEKPWSEHFEGELARNAVQGASGTYQPSFYSGRNWSTSSGGFSNTVASVAGGMSAAMIAAQPSSSSGSGFSGGGGSGGGGGGGGGGGW